jgi:hypothetical protein
LFSNEWQDTPGQGGQSSAKILDLQGINMQLDRNIRSMNEQEGENLPDCPEAKAIFPS